jgi:hypothetical protein
LQFTNNPNTYDTIAIANAKHRGQYNFNNIPMFMKFIGDCNKISRINFINFGMLKRKSRQPKIKEC